MRNLFAAPFVARIKFLRIALTNALAFRRRFFMDCRYSETAHLGQFTIAVGTPVARCPPHRPGRALISASGSSLGYERPTICSPHTPPPVEHAQARTVSGRCQVKECSP